MHLHTNRGSALLISLIVLTLITVMSTVFFEKLFQFSTASNGIENSNVAYYKALGSIEEAIGTGAVTKNTPWKVEGQNKGSTTSSGVKLSVTTGATSVPAIGKGNSPYDKNYNIISLGEPVQLVVPEGVTWTNVYFQFRIPQISQATQTGVAPAGTSSGYILWTLASSGMSLFASGETNIFKGSDIGVTNLTIVGFNGTTNTGSSSTFDNFYTNSTYLGTNGVKCTNYQCTLKLSLIRPVPTNDSPSRQLPFLEYKITGFASSIPSQYMNLSAEGYAYGFLRRREYRFPQITTNTALDFAVLQ